jgi:hypothetical protein
MGQTLGRAPLLPASRHFSNLPKRVVYKLWGRYSEMAEGLGLTQDEFLAVLRSCLKDHLEYSEKKLDLISKVSIYTHAQADVCACTYIIVRRGLEGGKKAPTRYAASRWAGDVPCVGAILCAPASNLQSIFVLLSCHHASARLETPSGSPFFSLLASAFSPPTPQNPTGGVRDARRRRERLGGRA